MTERSSNETFDLSRLLNERLKALKKFFAEVNYGVNADIAENINFYGDRRSIGKAVDLIIENSLVHNENRDIEITVKLSQSDDQILLQISDNGKGVKKEELGNIFDQFYRAGPELTRPSQGTGLGLYIVREIINAHHGNISVESDGPAKGITFFIRLKKGNQN